MIFVRIAKDKENMIFSIVDASEGKDIFLVQYGDPDFIGGWDDILVKDGYESVEVGCKKMIQAVFTVVLSR